MGVRPDRRWVDVRWRCERRAGSVDRAWAGAATTRRLAGPGTVALARTDVDRNAAAGADRHGAASGRRPVAEPDHRTRADGDGYRDSDADGATADGFALPGRHDDRVALPGRNLVVHGVAGAGRLSVRE
jgi:hypothetical protein